MATTVTVSERAAQRIGEILIAEAPGTMLRVSVEGGGCSGFPSRSGARPIFADLVMKLIAHRGWSAGGDENTLAAFARAASNQRIAGVEFDVCCAADAMTPVVSHDPPLHGENPLTLDAALSFLSRTNLELCVEIKQSGLAPMVIEKLVSGNMADRSVVFAFAGIARSFPWEGA